MPVRSKAMAIPPISPALERYKPRELRKWTGLQPSGKLPSSIEARSVTYQPSSLTPQSSARAANAEYPPQF